VRVESLVTPALMALWAKLRKEHGQEGACHPLVYHLLDVAASAEALWEKVLTEPARARIAGNLGLAVDDAGHWIAFLAGLHDIGKASPAFFHQDPDGSGRLQSVGTAPGPKVEKAPHGTISARDLIAILSSYGVDRKLALRMAMVVGGHHGQIPSADDMKVIPLHCVGGEPWTEMRRALTDVLARALGLPKDRAPSRLDNAAALWLAGLVSVADWIGSNQSYFGFAAPDAQHPPAYDGAYLPRARIWAQKALAELGWMAQPGAPTERTFHELFGYEPNPMQRAVLDIEGLLDRPGVVIVEAPMGDGKTEAALWLADQWRTRLGQRGMYIALPTQATSDQMFSRVAKFLLERYPDTVTHLQLLHGHASLSAHFAEVRRRGDVAFQPEHVGDDSAGAIAAAEWFTYRKRGLLAPFGVGTIDQALLSALQTKHVFVRLFGLAHKTIIVDEVHAYDVYMSALLDRLMEWLAAMGSTVVLLSATLPNERRRELAAAYGHGMGVDAEVPDAPYPRLTWLGADGSEARAIPIKQSKTIAVSWVQGASSEEGGTFVLGEQLRTSLSNGGTAVVICNTVGRAQEVYRSLKPYFSEHASVGHPELDLLHARFPFDMREERERRTLLRFGKEGAEIEVGNGVIKTVQRPYRAVLVATQIVEQSLDLDFDLMVTDLAPVDLLLQRAGRLWRHDRGKRPVDSAQLWIVQPPEDEDGLPQFDRGSQRVYFPHVLLRSWLALRGRTELHVPEDMAGLVEAAYGPASTEGLSPAVKALWTQTEEIQEEQLALERREAGFRLIAEPDDGGRLNEIQGGAREEDCPDLHPAHQAMTRLGDPSIPVVLLERRGDRLTLPDGSTIDPQSEPKGDVARSLLRRSLTLGDRRVLWALMETSPPAGWSRSALLQHHRLVALSPEGRETMGKYDFVLDPELGVVIGEKER
jgi:CRISPR-associated endonuclease/helicase Cas3